VSDAPWVEEFVADFRSVRLPPAESAMLEFCERLSRTPPVTGEAAVARLREHGFDDRAILDICQIASYFAFVNRMADGLGVELEDECR
jgi:uncharacterized peroxidase-related enzyme